MKSEKVLLFPSPQLSLWALLPFPLFVFPQALLRCNLFSGLSWLAQLVKNLPTRQETLVRFLG